MKCEKIMAWIMSSLSATLILFLAVPQWQGYLDRLWSIDFCGYIATVMLSISTVLCFVAGKRDGAVYRLLLGINFILLIFGIIIFLRPGNNPKTDPRVNKTEEYRILESAPR